MQRLPVDGGGFRQLRKRPAVPARARAECERVVIQEIRQCAQSGRLDEGAQPRVRLARRAAPQPQERAGLVEHGRFRFVRLFGGERSDEFGAPRRFARGNRGAERPFVDFGRRKKLVRRRGKRERGARLVDDGALGRFGPAQFPASAAHEAFPIAERRRVAFAGLEHGAWAVEEPVVAGQATRVGERRCIRLTQSDASGA